MKPKPKPTRNPKPTRSPKPKPSLSSWAGLNPDPGPYICAIKDVGTYSVYSTLLLSEALWRGERPHETRWFCYSIGQQVPGSPRTMAATRLETNLPVANQFVDEGMSITQIELVIPHVALADYQINPEAGPYKVTEEDVASLMASAYVGFFAGGEKAFVEAVLMDLPTISVEELSDQLPESGFSYEGVGGWIMRLQKNEDTPLNIGRIEKFWGALDCGMRSPPCFGRHAYNPAVIPMAMILTGKRTRAVA